MPTGNTRQRLIRASVLVAIGLVAAWSWLFVISKWGPARRIDILTFKAGLTSKVMRTLLQPARGTGHHDHASASVSGIYATPEYYAMTEQSEDAAKYLPDRFAIFYVFEEIHVGVLPPSPPILTLLTEDGRRLQPLDTTLVTDSEHHRATLARFPRTDAGGVPVIDEGASFFELLAHDMTGHSEQAMRWDLPIVYPNETAESDLSLPTLFALLAGLLAVLSPCLLQLTIYYTFALAGMSMQQGVESAGARGRVVRTALCFMAGFTIVFTAAGALAGMAGDRLQSSGIMDGLNRPLGIAAGTGILLLGVAMGANAGAPGLCRLPMFARLGMRGRWSEALKMMFLGSAFAIGCSTCFGGALFISLMIYVGAVGSASVGALALFLFSLGIGVPYLVSAFFLSKALPLVGSLQRVASGVGFACSAALIFFGVILITDSFHIPSSALYRLYLGL
jgi:cytochrome c-type biogenesis protein